MEMTDKKSGRENLFDLLDRLIVYETEKGIRFNEKGYPVFEDWMFYRGDVSYMRPFRHRNDSPSKANTLICFYEPDAALYPKLYEPKLKATGIELLKYAGFVGFDLSIFKDFLYPLQELYVLANLVIDMYFILEGNKMVPNLRADQTGGLSYFHLFKKAPIVCCGTLGCSKRKEIKQINRSLISRYSDEHPEQLIIQYGPKLVDKENTVSLNAYGRKRTTNG